MFEICGMTISCGHGADLHQPVDVRHGLLAYVCLYSNDRFRLSGRRHPCTEPLAGRRRGGMMHREAWACWWRIGSAGLLRSSAKGVLVVSRRVFASACSQSSALSIKCASFRQVMALLAGCFEHCKTCHARQLARRLAGFHRTCIRKMQASTCGSMKPELH